MIKVGLTGGIGSGKTLVSQLFTLLSIPIYNADDRARYIQTNNKEVIKEITLLFGPQAYENGQLNRTLIAQLVFSNKAKLEKLNAIVHPKVREDFADWLKEHKSSPYIIKEAAIFFESGTDSEMDKMITIYAPQELRIQRVLARDPHRTTEDIKSIMEKQMSEEEKVNRSDYVIYNDNKQLVIPQVMEIDKTLRKKL